VHSYAAASRADTTWKAYQSDLRHYAAWCSQHGITDPVPAEPHTVAAYLADYAGRLAVSTLARRLYALAAIHRMGGHPVPTEAPEVQAVWSGIKRTHGTAPRQKAPTRTKIIARMLKQLGGSPADVRDRALLLIGFAGAFRRSELVALDVEDVTDTEDGLHIAVRRSKSDQEGAGDVVGIPYGSNPVTCPVRAWLDVRREVNGTAEGPAFVSIPKAAWAAAPTGGPSCSSPARRITRSGWT
jgi:site-specific recombinase XerD